MTPKQVFISYSSKDRETVDKICGLLEDDGISCWIAPRDVTGGKSYGREILEAITDAKVVLFIFSESSNRSRHVENEIDNAFNAEKIIIPFKIDESKTSLELQYYLNKTHWIDGCTVNEDSINNLKKAIWANLPVELPSLHTEDIEQEREYNILQNGADEILIMINYKQTEPENPRIIYDGEDCALLCRNRKSAMMLNAINEQARAPLSSVDTVLIVEIKDDDVAREYKVPVRHVKSLKHLMQ